MGAVTSCCESCCKILSFLLHIYTRANISILRQSVRAGRTHMNLYCWKVSERRLPSYFNTLRVNISSYSDYQTTNYSLDRATTNFFTGSPLLALTTLSFSDNVDLQRSAALAFAEITEKEVRPVGRDTLDPILFLLSSHDTEVQRAASAALGNLAVNSMCQRPV